MKNLIDRANKILAGMGVNANVATVLAFTVLIVAILSVTYRDPAITGLIILIVVLISHATDATDPPKPAEIADTMGVFLETACSSLKDRLAVFQSLYFDTIPIEGTDQRQYFPRWDWRTMTRDGIKIIQIGLLRLSKTAFSADTLLQERRVLQDLLSDNLRRGLIPLAAHPTYSDGTPTLYLLEIKEDGSYLSFGFVWVCNQKSADFVRRFGLPPDDGNTDDQDF